VSLILDEFHKFYYVFPIIFIGINVLEEIRNQVFLFIPLFQTFDGPDLNLLIFGIEKEFISEVQEFKV